MNVYCFSGSGGREFSERRGFVRFSFFGDSPDGDWALTGPFVTLAGFAALGSLEALTGFAGLGSLGALSAFGATAVWGASSVAEAFSGTGGGSTDWAARTASSRGKFAPGVWAGTGRTSVFGAGFTSLDGFPERTFFLARTRVTRVAARPTRLVGRRGTGLRVVALRRRAFGFVLTCFFFARTRPLAFLLAWERATARRAVGRRDFTFLRGRVTRRLVRATLRLFVATTARFRTGFLALRRTARLFFFFAADVRVAFAVERFAFRLEDLRFSASLLEAVVLRRGFFARRRWERVGRAGMVH